MFESQPPTVVEGATTGDVEDEIPQAAKSAEDRKAAAAMSSLDAPREDDSTNTKQIDQEAVRKAMDRLSGKEATNGIVAKKSDERKVVKKIVKVEAADVTLLVCSFARTEGAEILNTSLARVKVPLFRIKSLFLATTTTALDPLKPHGIGL